MRNSFRSRHYGPGCGPMLIWMCVVLFLFIGYVKNIIHLCQCDFEPKYKAEVLYGVGTCAPPLGGIFGWFDFGK